MYRKTLHHPGLTALVLPFLFALTSGLAVAGDANKADYTSMTPEELAEHLIFKANGFDTAMETQEGTTVGERLTQDELQKTCSRLKGDNPDSATAQKVTELARQSMEYPDGGIELGDWQEGQAIAENAFGFRVGHNVDDHSANETGGMCINCHALEADKAHRSGTIGPSLVGYGARGTSEQMMKYTYEVIYNPHAFFACTKMPRIGANGILSQEKIADVMAYLMNPDSPVNP